VDYLVSVSSTLGQAEPAPLSVSASAQERYPREALDVETVTSGVGALVVGQVIGILEAP
jgi:hypothetical protein